MQSAAASPRDYINGMPQDRKEAVKKLRNTILQNLPKGFEEVMSYGMLGYVVPHTIYPAGYHADPKLPLPFINIASQKNYVALYHIGLTADEGLLDWFTKEYPKHSASKLDMGKSCIRFKKIDAIPYQLLGELAARRSPQQWIALYEKSLKK